MEGQRSSTGDGLRSSEGRSRTRLEVLPWDSAHFGVGIGRADLADADEAAVREVEASAREAGLQCLYASLDPLDAAATYRLQTLGYRFVEAGLTFDLQPGEPPIDEPPGFTFREGSGADVPALLGLVEAMAPWSRYAADPRFGLEAAVRLQRAWLDRAVGDDPAHSIVVAQSEADCELVAFIGRVTTPSPRVDAVGTTRRGSGAARYLIETARAWAGDRPLLGGPIAARNVAALRYVSHCAYRVAKVEYHYHRWLDEG